MLPKTDSLNEAVPESDRPRLPSTLRRRLLRGGLVAAPVILTVASRPVHAGCLAASAFASINTSGNKRPDISCTGNTPDWYRDNPNALTAAQKTKTFGSVFAGRSLWVNKTLPEVLALKGTAANEAVARYLVAGWLNVTKNAASSPVYTASTLTNIIWPEFLATGNYSPSAGIKWQADQLRAWLSTTMV